MRRDYKRGPDWSGALVTIACVLLVILLIYVQTKLP